MYKNPGEYEIKVLENGKLARTAKFTMGGEGQLVDTGIGLKNNLGTGRIVVAVQVIGDQDGIWESQRLQDRCLFRKSFDCIHSMTDLWSIGYDSACRMFIES